MTDISKAAIYCSSLIVLLNLALVAGIMWPSGAP